MIYSKALQTIALPWVSRLTESKFWDIYRGFTRNPESLFAPPASTTVDRISELVSHAYDLVPYYREKLDAAGIHPRDITSLDAFRRIPFTPKADFSANFPDRITATNKPYRPWRFVSTTGTIERLTSIHDFRKRDYVRTTQLLAMHFASGYELGMRYLELPPDICRNVCGASYTADPPVFKYVVENLKARKLSDPDVISDLKGLIETQLVYRRLQLPSVPGRGLVQKPDVLDEYLDHIDRYDPHIAKALPAHLYLLALRNESRGRQIRKLSGGVMPMGGSITPFMKRTVERGFGMKVFEDYGCAELGSLGAEAQGLPGIRPFAAVMHVEVEVDGRPARPGEIGKVLVTDLYSYAMPFIRYQIGDVARVLDDSGRLEILGRIDDCIPASDGRPITSDEMMDSLLPHPDVLAFQLEYRPGNRIELQVVPSNGSVRFDELTDKLQSLTGSGTTVRARTVPTIASEPGGKFRFVKNLSDRRPL